MTDEFMNYGVLGIEMVLDLAGIAKRKSIGCGVLRR